MFVFFVKRNHTFDTEKQPVPRRETKCFFKMRKDSANQLKFK